VLTSVDELVEGLVKGSVDMTAQNASGGS